MTQMTGNVPRWILAAALLAMAPGASLAQESCLDQLDRLADVDPETRVEDTPSARVDQYMVVNGIHLEEGGGETMRMRGAGPVENWFGQPPRSIEAAAKTEAQKLREAGDEEGCKRVLRNARALTSEG